MSAPMAEGLGSITQRHLCQCAVAYILDAHPPPICQPASSCHPGFPCLIRSVTSVAEPLASTLSPVFCAAQADAWQDGMASRPARCTGAAVAAAAALMESLAAGGGGGGRVLLLDGRPRNAGPGAGRVAGQGRRHPHAQGAFGAVSVLSLTWKTERDNAERHALHLMARRQQRLHVTADRSPWREGVVATAGRGLR